MRWLPWPDWSYMIEIRQVVPLQKATWVAALATPPAESGLMSVVALSEPRMTYDSRLVYLILVP